MITTLISDVATAYFNLLELDMELAIARNTLGTREESLRLIRTQCKAEWGRFWMCARESSWFTAPRSPYRAQSNK